MNMRKLYVIKKGKEYLRKKIIIYDLKRTERVRNKIIKRGISNNYLPAMIDFAQILRCDGNKNSWSGGGYYSQCGQDWFINYLFNDKKDGFFIDIGGNDPTKINNTFFFERKGWRGLAFEPLQKYQLKWKQERTTMCLPIALGNEEKEVKFREMNQDYLSGIDGVNIQEIQKYLENGEVKVVGETIVKQRMLKDVLSENNIKEVDFISLDVEGYELQVLQGIDFDKVEIRCFTIENEDNVEMIYKIRKYLLDRGYWLIARLGQDDVFVLRKYFYKEG